MINVRRAQSKRRPLAPYLYEFETHENTNIDLNFSFFVLGEHNFNVEINNAYQNKSIHNDWSTINLLTYNMLKASKPLL